MLRAVSAFFIGSWGILAGLFFAGLFIMAGKPVKPFDHAMWGAYALFFSTMSCVGMGRFIEDVKFGKILGTISGVVVVLVFALRALGILPS